MNLIILILIIFLQIVLESLPISSSGHLELFSKILNFNISEYLDYFLHGPTIIVLAVVFFKDWFYPVLHLLKGIFKRFKFFVRSVGKRFSVCIGMTNKVDNKNYVQNNSIQKIFLSEYSYKRLLKIFIKILLLVFVSDVITTLIWFFRKNFLINNFVLNSNLVLLIGFCITSFFLFSLRLNVKRTKKLNIFFKFMILGFVQGFALLPGVSRFASVYASARLLNITQRRAFQITFLLQFPLVLAGFFLGIYKINKFRYWANVLNFSVLISMLFATIISIFVLLWCKRLAKNNKLWRFGLYMLIPIFILLYWII